MSLRSQDEQINKDRLKMKVQDGIDMSKFKDQLLVGQKMVIPQQEQNPPKRKQSSQNQERPAMSSKQQVYQYI